MSAVFKKKRWAKRLCLGGSALLWSYGVLSGCFEPKEGCLEPDALNLEISADRACCCCCAYPHLQLTYEPRFDSAVWVPNTAYEYAPGRWFRIKEAVFYLSDFQFFNNGQAFAVSDTAQLPVLTPSADTAYRVFRDDFVFLRRTILNYDIGEFRFLGTLQDVHFRVGLPDEVQRVLSPSVSAAHPLGPKSESLWQGVDTGFAALKLVIARDTLPAAPSDTLLFTPPDFSSKVLVSAGPFTRERGRSLSLKLRVDFYQLFRDVDLLNHDISAWKSKIWANLEEAIRVLPE